MGRYKDEKLNDNRNPNKRHGKCEQCGRKTILHRVSMYNTIWLCENCRKSHTIDETKILHQIGLNKKK